MGEPIYVAGKQAVPVVHGYRSLSPLPIRSFLAAFVAAVVVVLVILTVTHLHPATDPAATDPVPSTVAPAPTATPARTCYPLQATPC